MEPLAALNSHDPSADFHCQMQCASGDFVCAPGSVALSPGVVLCFLKKRELVVLDQCFRYRENCSGLIVLRVFHTYLTYSLSFPDHAFSSVVAVLVLHHLRSPELQNAAFQEFHRVLRPGGMFFAFEIPDGWLQHAVHIRSTFVPVYVPSNPSSKRR